MSELNIAYLKADIATINDILLRLGPDQFLERSGFEHLKKLRERELVVLEIMLAGENMICDKTIIWETVNADTMRLKVPGGWLYKQVGNNNNWGAFVPECSLEDRRSILLEVAEYLCIYCASKDDPPERDVAGAWKHTFSSCHVPGIRSMIAACGKQ